MNSYTFKYSGTLVIEAANEEDGEAKAAHQLPYSIDEITLVDVAPVNPED